MFPVVEIVLPQPPVANNVPAFLAKLWKMVNNPDADSLICWGSEGNSFIIRNQTEFAKTLLPYYYKHSNMASFVRQLNMYGFHKVVGVDSGGLKGENDETEFAHTFFIRGQEHLLDQIKRKVATKGGPTAQFVPSIRTDRVNDVLVEVGALRERQEEVDGKLDSMRSENEALWGEVLSLRQKHNQQQKIVNKLIQFLVALVQPRGMKRGFPSSRGMAGSQLAIEEVGAGQGEPLQPGPAKQARLDLEDIVGASFLQAGDSGATIQELPADLSSAQLQDVITTASPAPQAAPGDSASKYRMVDPVSVNSSLVTRPTLQRELSREDLDTDLSSVQKDLDNLKEILSGQITLDTSLVSSLFNADSDTVNGMNLFSDSLLPAEEEAAVEAGTQSVTYSPGIFLTEQQNSPDSVSVFDGVDLNTPLVNEDTEDPMKKVFGK